MDKMERLHQLFQERDDAFVAEEAAFAAWVAAPPGDSQTQEAWMAASARREAAHASWHALQDQA